MLLVRVERRAHRCHWPCAMGTSGTSETQDRSYHRLKQIFVAVIRKIHLCACGLEWVSIQLNVPECASTCWGLKNNKLKARHCKALHWGHSLQQGASLHVERQAVWTFMPYHFDWLIYESCTLILQVHSRNCWEAIPTSVVPLDTVEYSYIHVKSVGILLISQIVN